MARQSLDLWRYARSSWCGWRSSGLFSQLESFVMFVGQPLGGATFLGALLNAHPHICLAHELHVLQYLAQGYRRSQLFWMLYERDRDFGCRGRRDNDYRFAVPGQWQGVAQQIRVLGDIKAGATADRLADDPSLLERLHATVDRPVRWIHVVRNPFDVIGAIHRRRMNRSLEWAVENYFGRTATVWQLMNTSRTQLTTVHWHDLLVHPRATLTQLLEALHLEGDTCYLDACQWVVSEHQRLRVASAVAPLVWPRSLVRSVMQRLQTYPFLQAYSFPERRVWRSAA